MRVSSTATPPTAGDADTIAVGIFEAGGAPDFSPAEVSDLVDAREARPTLGALALAHAEGRRWLIVGLGPRERFDAERARVAAAAACSRAREISTRVLGWSLPDGTGPQIAAGLVQGTVLADYRFDRAKGKGASESERDAPPKHLEALEIASAEPGVEQAVAEAAVVAEAANRARDLQNRPANDLTPSALAERATELAGEVASLSTEVEGRSGIIARGMGAFAAVAQGSDEEPALITVRYRGGGESGPVLGLVGKGVTFDSGGISLKPSAKMSEMKFDMSGAASVLEAIGAIARLELPLDVIAVLGATENLPSGHSVKPGDVVTAANGLTVEVNNTDAEGRLVLADCLWYAIEQGAERVIDLATLTGAVIVALGSTYSGLMSNDDEFAGRILDAGERSGEIVWRLPLHEEYDELIKGTFGDLDNAPEARKAGTIVGGSFLAKFVGDVPWGHLDIAGSAWDLGRPYVGKGASGYGVRLLVELARSYCA
jgi:leucyl aminopeptidase